MESSLIDAFVNKTGADPETAQMYLQTYNWDLNLGVEKYQSYEDTRRFNKAAARRLVRGISRAADNEHLVLRARDAIAKDFENNRLCRVTDFYVDAPETTFSLPDFGTYHEDFRTYLENDLIERSVIASLEKCNRLNWWCQYIGNSNRLWPLVTSGDGNCLLHAASLTTYGFHDRLLTLRNALHSFFLGSGSMAAIQRRWRWQNTKENKIVGVRYSEKQWEQEWNGVVSMASSKKRNSNEDGNYEGLEGLHIFVLAHVLQRPIIVISDVFFKDHFDQPLAPNNFGGIYIPFECEERKCSKTPILLSFDLSHFSGLVFMDRDNGGTIPSIFQVPIVDSSGNILPIQFSVDPGSNFNWSYNSVADLTAQENNDNDPLPMLRKHLSIVDASGSTGSPDESEDDNDQPDMIAKRNKAARQLEVFGKPFEIIGKSVSKTFRKNFGSRTKLSGKPKKKPEFIERLWCAEVYIKRHAFQDEMIHNYIKFATQKFIQVFLLAKVPGNTSEELLLKDQAIKEGLVVCVNHDCDFYATCATSYMCQRCYDAQKTHELAKRTEAQFGIGQSVFYSEPDQASYSAVKQLPKSFTKGNRTLYLSNSTFFNDTDTPFRGFDNNNMNRTDLNENIKDLNIIDNSENIPLENLRNKRQSTNNFDLGMSIPENIQKLAMEFEEENLQLYGSYVSKRLPFKQEVVADNEQPIKYRDSGTKNPKTPPNSPNNSPKNAEE